MGLKKNVVIYIFTFLLIALVVWFFYRNDEQIGKILRPFFIAVIIAYLIHPVVIKLERKKINRMTGIILIYVLFSISVVSIIIFIIPSIIGNTKDLITTIPHIASNYESMFINFMSGIQSSNWPEELKITISREIQNGIDILQNKLTDGLRHSLVVFVNTATALFDLILAMIIAYYFIKDTDFFREAFLSLTPRRWRNGIIVTCREINGVLSNFIQGQLLTALIVGVLETIGLLIVKTKYPLVLGLIGGIANIIPYFGPILGAIPAVSVALIESPVKAVWTALVFIIIQQIDNVFISPKIIEGRLGLHPVSTILAVLIGGEFFGIIGMLVSVPIAAILKIIIKRTVDMIA